MSTGIEGRPRGWKKATLTRLREILHYTIDGQPLDDEDFTFVLGVLELHPDADQKIGPGIAFITAGPSGPPGTRVRGFFAYRHDGTSTDFSFMKCLSAPSHASEIRAALRRVVATDVVAFKKAAFARNPTCEVTGVPLTPDMAHVDHYDPSFLELANEWAAMRGGYGKVPLQPLRDNQVGRDLDSCDATSWLSHHRTKANLRLVSANANLSILRRSQGPAA